MQSDNEPTAMFLSSAEKTWRRIAKAAWSKPSSLTAEFVEQVTCGLPRLELDRTIDLLAFSGTSVPEDEIEQSAYRYRAFRAICEAARDERIQLIGKDKDGAVNDQLIKASYFDYPRISEKGNKITSEVIIEALTESDIQQYIRQREMGHQTWLEARIIVSSLNAWLFPAKKVFKKTAVIETVKGILLELGEKANAPYKVLIPMVEEKLGFKTNSKMIQRARKR